MSEDPKIQQERRDECRISVRKYLAERIPLAFHPRVIQRRLNEGHASDFTEDEVKAALAVLQGEGQAATEHADVGAVLYYKATSAGVLANERRRQ